MEEYRRRNEVTHCTMCGVLLDDENHSREYEDCDFCYDIDHEGEDD